VNGRHRGITLIELLTVVVVIAILASIAVPSYRNYLIRSQRAEAKTALLQLRAAQEQFYLNRNAYTDDVAGAPPDGLGLTAVSETGKYAISVDLDADGQGYTATAAPAAGGGQEDDDTCGSLTITDTGVRGIEGGTGTVEECWR
jgi:type IV pilus assembly protein PilE